MAGIDWPGLLAWSTRYHDGTSPSQFSEMSQEDKRFLEKALELAFSQIEDPNKVMQEAVVQLQSPERTSTSVLTSLEVIDKCCDDPDCARNAEKLGAIQVLLDLLGEYPGVVRVRILEILALLFANNPNIQKAAVDRGALESLLTGTQDAPACSDERLKSLRAVAALTRGSPELEARFLQADVGLAVLLTCMKPEENAKIQEKACALVITFAHERRLTDDQGLQLGTALVPLLLDASATGLQHRETVAACALELAQALPSHPELPAAVQARLEEVKRRADADEQPEQELLQACSSAMSAR